MGKSERRSNLEWGGDITATRTLGRKTTPPRMFKGFSNQELRDDPGLVRRSGVTYSPALIEQQLLATEEVLTGLKQQAQRGIPIAPETLAQVKITQRELRQRYIRLVRSNNPKKGGV